MAIIGRPRGQKRAGGGSPTPSGERGPLERKPFESFRGLTPTNARARFARFHAAVPRGALSFPEEGSVPSAVEERSCDAGLGAMSAPSPPPPRPPLPPPGVDQSAWPAPPKCPGSALCDASGADMRRQAPKVFDVVFHTTTGDVRVRAWRDLAPAGADRLYNLARLGYYDSSPLYRILPGFVAQFGVAADPSVSAVYDWRKNSPGAILPDEPTHASSSGNAKHWISYSASYDSITGMATNRTAELFINLADNRDRLDAKGFAAFAKVIAGGSGGRMVRGVRGDARRVRPAQGPGLGVRWTGGNTAVRAGCWVRKLRLSVGSYREMRTWTSTRRARMSTTASSICRTSARTARRRGWRSRWCACAEPARG